MSNTGSDKFTNATTNANGDFHICDEFDWRSCTNRGFNEHLRSCYLKKKITYVQSPHERNEGDRNDQTSDDSNIEIPHISTPSLRYKWANY